MQFFVLLLFYNGNYFMILFIWDLRMLCVQFRCAYAATKLSKSSNFEEHPVYIVFNGAYYSLVEFSIHTFTKGVTPAWFPVVIQFVLVGFLSCHAYVTKPCNLTWCSFHYRNKNMHSRYVIMVKCSSKSYIS